MKKNMLAGQPEELVKEVEEDVYSFIQQVCEESEMSSGMTVLFLEIVRLKVELVILKKRIEE